ncbi:hypothetical protein TR51_19030 [Kitasatospora griseola]|uniref:Uncharacterized protein n=1 Tax=Kitasatospora griseola TaxID=2064 RepID=A0A0D0PTE5_KITGR|nr:hypothetical protein [Kitasatospora griseola]KIQ65829.1 hypothetical protein TR51_19030 [Kitasatospora griseola]
MGFWPPFAVLVAVAEGAAEAGAAAPVPELSGSQAVRARAEAARAAATVGRLKRMLVFLKRVAVNMGTLAVNRSTPRGPTFTSKIQWMDILPDPMNRITPIRPLTVPLETNP